jgi:uncharacterized protein YegP (UPF0339 family)
MGNPKFVIKTSGGQFYFLLATAAGEVVLISERYTTRRNAEGCIQSAKVNSTVDQRYDRRLSQHREHYFVLRGGEHEVIGMSEMYDSATAMEDGIVAVKRSAAVAAVEGA